MAGDEWGHPIEHDGSNQPVPDGTFVEVVFLDGDTDQAFADEFAWSHSQLGEFWPGYIIRYRIRKPRGLAILECLLNARPAPAEREAA